MVHVLQSLCISVVIVGPASLIGLVSVPSVPGFFRSLSFLIALSIVSCYYYSIIISVIFAVISCFKVAYQYSFRIQLFHICCSFWLCLSTVSVHVYHVCSTILAVFP